METNLLSVSDFIALTNQTLEYAYPTVLIQGEVSSFNVNQGKFVFFDLKDNTGKIGCFMMLFNLRIALEDGMKVIVQASPKLTSLGKFSLTVQRIQPVGEGSIKKSFELLKEKLTKEGLFDDARKRQLPVIPKKVGVVSSTNAAGYADFIKISNDRWGGVEFLVADVSVQGLSASDQIISALEYFNSSDELVEVIVVIRGGGSSDDLAVFNDEKLVRTIALSRIPTLLGIGHETDITLAELASDRRASTPSNAAQILLPDKKDILNSVRHKLSMIGYLYQTELDRKLEHLNDSLKKVSNQISNLLENYLISLNSKVDKLTAYNPSTVLSKGYAVLRGELNPDSIIDIETYKKLIKAKVISVNEKK